MPPPQHGAPAVELDEGTEKAISGHMEAHTKAPFLDPALCLICLGHTFGPAVMVTASCGHHFHPKCIEDARKQNKTKCPCGAAFPPGREPVVEAARMHKQMMNAVEVQCPQGCGGVMQFERLRAHVHNADGCPNTPYRCGNQGCGERFLRKDKDAHLRNCPHRITPCELCRQPVRDRELQQHKAELCPQRRVRCPHCDAQHTFMNTEEHMRGCTGVVTMRDLVELREMMAQQQAATAQLRDQVAWQQQTIAEQQQRNAEQQQTIERQQGEIAELREVTGPLREEQRRQREEEQRLQREMEQQEQREMEQRRQQEEQRRQQEEQRRQQEEQRRQQLGAGSAAGGYVGAPMGKGKGKGKCDGRGGYQYYGYSYVHGAPAAPNDGW